MKKLTGDSEVQTTTFANSEVDEHRRQSLDYANGTISEKPEFAEESSCLQRTIKKPLAQGPNLQTQVSSRD